MKIRVPALAAALAVVLVLAGTAYAFDCIRVSSSRQGLFQSAKSGNWLPFDFGSAAGVKQTFADVFGASLNDTQAGCIATAYGASGQPKYFALGVGVAGGKKTSVPSNGARAAGDGFGVIAWHNQNLRVLSNGKGIDHIDDSPILTALVKAAGGCGVPIGP